jgi:hypothetical protein
MGSTQQTVGAYCAGLRCQFVGIQKLGSKVSSALFSPFSLWMKHKVAPYPYGVSPKTGSA